MLECQRAVGGVPFGKVAPLLCWWGCDSGVYVHTQRPGEVMWREGQLPVTISLIQRCIHSMYLSTFCLLFFSLGGRRSASPQPWTPMSSDGLSRMRVSTSFLNSNLLKFTHWKIVNCRLLAKHHLKTDRGLPSSICSIYTHCWILGLFL